MLQILFQGDIAFEEFVPGNKRFDWWDRDTPKLKIENGQAIVALGERTGHAHVIDAKTIDNPPFQWGSPPVGFIGVVQVKDEPTQVKHVQLREGVAADERLHDPITLKPNTLYLVRQQRQLNLGDMRLDAASRALYD